MANIIKITLPDGSTYDVGNSLCLGINNQTWNAEETQFTGTLDYTKDEILNLLTNGTFVWFQYYDSSYDDVIMLFPSGDNYWRDLEYYRVAFLTANGITVQVRPGYATLSSPAFTGTPTAPTPSILSNNTQIATTAFVHNVMDSLKNVKIYYVLPYHSHGAWSGQDYSTYNFAEATIFKENDNTSDTVSTDSIYDDLCDGILVILRVLDPNDCPVYCFPSVIGDDASWMNFSATYTTSDTDELVTLNLTMNINEYDVCDGHYSLPSGGSELPSVTSSDNGKFLRVVNGAWAAATVPDANGVSF